MSRVVVATRYTQRNIEQMLGLSKSVVASLVKAGYVTPKRGARNENLFSFQDIVLLRTAHKLRASNIPVRRLVSSLKQLRAKLPTEAPLSGLRIRAIGNEVAVRDGNAPWEISSGQLLIDFEVSSSSGGVAILERPGWATPDTATAAEMLRLGQALERSEPSAAESAYRAALEIDPVYVDAALNLGAMLCESMRSAEAVDLYDKLLTLAPGEPMVYFNAAIALEDQGRHSDALLHYERCIDLAPELADAHYNAARLCEMMGDATAALRHYSSYRRIQRAAGEPAS